MEITGSKKISESIVERSPIRRRFGLIASFDHADFLMRSAKVLVVLAAIQAEVANAACVSLVKGAVAVDVNSCTQVDPSAFDPASPAAKVFKDLDQVGRNKLMSEYRGLLLKGIVVRSQANRDGLNPEKGVLQGESHLFYVKPGQAQCQNLQNRRVVAVVDEQCCDGRPDAPCLLDTGLVLEKVSVQGTAKVEESGKSQLANSSAGKKKSEKYLAAEKLYIEKKYKESAQAYKKLDESELDVKGLFRWANALRETDDCTNAIKPLKKIYDLSQTGKIWKEDELDGRRGVFLLARCHSKLNQPSEAVFYLNGFLLDPKKYRSEIVQSLKHKDFGWIHTSKEYKEYKESAKKVLQ